MEAYNLFLRGREQAWLTTKSGNIETHKLLGLLAINPNFAAALGVLTVHVIDYANGWGDLPEGCLKTGLETAERAIQIDGEELKATLP